VLLIELVGKRGKLYVYVIQVGDILPDLAPDLNCEKCDLNIENCDHMKILKITMQILKMAI
jgi:hypothetical protein